VMMTVLGDSMVNIARTIFGLDKKPEVVEEKPDPRLERTSKFVRPVKLPDKSDEEE